MTVELTQGTVGQPAVYTAEARETSSQLEAIQLIFPGVFLKSLGSVVTGLVTRVWIMLLLLFSH